MAAPVLQIIAVEHDPAEVQRDIYIQVVVTNPGDEVLAELLRLCKTQAKIVVDAR